MLPLVVAAAEQVGSSILFQRPWRNLVRKSGGFAGCRGADDIDKSCSILVVDGAVKHAQIPTKS
jgi:hypothetical protein